MDSRIYSVLSIQRVYILIMSLLVVRSLVSCPSPNHKCVRVCTYTDSASFIFGKVAIKWRDLEYLRVHTSLLWPLYIISITLHHVHAILIVVSGRWGEKFIATSILRKASFQQHLADFSQPGNLADYYYCSIYMPLLCISISSSFNAIPFPLLSILENHPCKLPLDVKRPISRSIILPSWAQSYWSWLWTVLYPL